MKKRLSKILGLVFIVAVMAGNIMGPVQISADTLAWSAETLPPGITAIDDVYVSPDGANVYLLGKSGSTTSLWRRFNGSWTMCNFTKNNTNGYIVRGAPDDNDYVCVADTGTSSFWYTRNAGEKWTVRAVPGSIQDMSAENSTALYVVTTIGTAYKSNSGGYVWSPLTIRNFNYPAGAADPQLIVVAPDDPDTVALVADDREVYVSVSGGQTWVDLPVPGQGTSAVPYKIYDIALSPKNGNFSYVVVAGESMTGGILSYFSLGALAPAWIDTVGNTSNWTKSWTGKPVGRNAFNAIAFSPNFAVDNTLVALSSKDAGGADALQLHALNFSTLAWDASFLTGYPVTVDSTAGKFTPGKASLTLAPNYSAGDAASRIAFAGYAGTDGGVQTGGIFRISDTQKTELTAAPAAIASVAYDGSILLAGSDDSNMVYRSADPLAAAPALSPASTAPAGKNKVIVSAAGGKVIAGTSGTGSAFSVSADGGVNFTALGLDKIGTDISDIAAAGDGFTIYITDSESNKLYKSTDGGLTWPENITMGKGCMINSLGDNRVIYGSTDGRVAYSEDGAYATVIDKPIESGTLLAQVTATGLNVGDYIFAASSKPGTGIWRCQIGNVIDWVKMDTNSTLTNLGVYGMKYFNGALYVLGSNGKDSEVLRCVDPTAASPAWTEFIAEGKVMNDTPQALQAGGDDFKLWAISTNDNTLQSCTISNETAITFPDPNLDAEIRQVIGKPSGDIYASELQAVVTLSAGGRNISDLTGLEYCVNLVELNLSLNQITSILPLAGLTQLAHLDLSYNQISDIASLADLTNLFNLQLGQNQIVDISSLAGLTKLIRLNLTQNKISDIQALVTNAGIDTGDDIDLKGNPLSLISFNTYVPQIQARGVNIEYDDIAPPSVTMLMPFTIKPPYVLSIGGTIPVIFRLADTRGAPVTGLEITVTLTRDRDNAVVFSGTPRIYGNYYMLSIKTQDLEPGAYTLKLSINPKYEYHVQLKTKNS